MIERAFIIDDDEISVFLTIMLLQNEHFARHIESFHFAGDALKRLQYMPDQQLPQVIFLDLNMPVLSGWDFLDALSPNEERYLNKCSIFILTSSVDAQEKEKSMQYSLVSGFLHKPLDEAELKRIQALV